MIQRARRSERGAALVEMAIVLPLLLIMVFGVMEAGWYYAQLSDTRNAAREGARLAVVDFGTTSQVADETCSRAAFGSGTAAVSISVTGDISDPASDPTAAVNVTIVKNYSSITGFFDSLFDGKSLNANVTMRAERPLDTLGGSVDLPLLSQVCP